VDAPLERSGARTTARSRWAWHYKQYDKDPSFAEAEKKARAEQPGLWKDKDPMPPWEWRKKEREKRKESTANQKGQSNDPGKLRETGKTNANRIAGIDENRIVKLVPIYGERVIGDEDARDNEDMFYVCSPGNPNAEIFLYEIVYCDNETYIAHPKVVDKALGVNRKPRQKIGFQLPVRKERKSGEGQGEDES